MQESRTWRRRPALLAASALAVPFAATLALPVATASAATGGHIEVCKSARNGMGGQAFSFSIDGGRSFTVLGGNCSGPKAVSAGSHTVTEAQNGTTSVAKITASPSGALTGSNRSAGTATLRVANGQDVIVTYINHTPPAKVKVCKQAESQLVGQPFSFTVNGGPAFSVNAGPIGSPNCSAVFTFQPGTNVTVQELQPASNVHVSSITVSQPPATNVSTNLASRTISFTAGSGVNVVTYTNRVTVTPGQGYIEICKQATDQFVSGYFHYSVRDSSGLVASDIPVLLGQCSGPILVTPGNVTITEAQRFPYFLDFVSVFPSGRLVSQNISNQSVTVTTPSVQNGDTSQETVATFFNDTRLGEIKVCKALTSNSGDLAGHQFTFTATSQYGTQTVTITANAPGQTAACTFLNALPLGTQVSITEQGQPNIQLVSVTVSPSSADNGSTNSQANITVISGITTVTFTNEALGTIEICKDSGDNVTTGQTFTFVINNSIVIQVKAGQCSNPIQVPAGTATVFEQSKANYHLVSVSATGPNGENRLISGPNPATVSVPFGGVGNETLVRFTNAANTGTFKICKASNFPSLVKGSYSYHWTVTGAGIGENGSDAGIATGIHVGECSTTFGPYPVVDANGNPVSVTVTEDNPNDGTVVTNITYQGNGNVTASSNAGRTITFHLGVGENVVTFTNDPQATGSSDRTAVRRL